MWSLRGRGRSLWARAGGRRVVVPEERRKRLLLLRARRRGLCGLVVGLRQRRRFGFEGLSRLVLRLRELWGRCGGWGWAASCCVFRVVRVVLEHSFL